MFKPYFGKQTMGRKKLLKMDIEGRDKLFRQIKSFLNSKLGKRKHYVLIISYEGEVRPEGINAHTQVFQNLGEDAPLAVWKVILVGLVNSVQSLLQRYNLGSGIRHENGAPSPTKPAGETRE